MSGRGGLFSWAVVERALAKPFSGRVPYVSGLIALDEAPEVRLVSYVVDCEPARLSVDLPMTVVYRPLEFTGVPGRVVAPFFKPLAEASGGRAAGDPT